MQTDGLTRSPESIGIPAPPAGLHVISTTLRITTERGPQFVASLPVARFYGVGPVTARKMERLGIASGDDLHSPALADRVLAEVVAKGSVVIGRSEVGAWCRT